MKNHILQLTRYTGQQVTDYEPSYLAKNENRNGDFDVFDPDQNWTDTIILMRYTILLGHLHILTYFLSNETIKSFTIFFLI